MRARAGAVLVARCVDSIERKAKRNCDIVHTFRWRCGAFVPASTKKRVKSKSVDQQVVSRKKRQRDVRGRILQLLADGTLKRAELVKRGRFSGSALFLHVKALREEGLITEDPDTRTLSLTYALPGDDLDIIDGEVVRHEVGQERSADRPLVSTGVSKELHLAMGTVLSRLAPIDNLPGKLFVLDQLACTTPKLVSEVLRTVMDDLQRLSS